jgi:hypothetical protein
MISLVPLYGEPADVETVVHDLRDDVGGEVLPGEFPAVQDVCERTQAAAPFFAAAVALVLASLSLYSAVSRERVEREGSKKKEYDSVADEWVHQRVTESESDDESVEALTVRTPLQ